MNSFMKKILPLAAGIALAPAAGAVPEARDLGIPVEERVFPRDELYCADEVFLTGTAAELTPVREIDDRKIGDGNAGAITKRLQEAFFGEVKNARKELALAVTYGTPGSAVVTSAKAVLAELAKIK